MRAAVAAGLATALASCGGGRTVVPLPQSPQGPYDRSVSHVVSPAVGGIMNVKTFTVPAGQTVIVTKDLAVFASSSVTIAGELQVPAGISVAFFTPAFTIKGPGGFIYAAANTKYDGHVDDVVSACQVSVQNSTQWQVGGSDNLALTASGKSTSKHPCTVTFGSNKNTVGKQTLVMEAGAAGGSYPHRYVGGNGGWIEIGSPEAIAYTETLAKHDGHTGTKVYAFASVVLNSQIAGGNGGNGRNDTEGTQSGSDWNFTAYSGGIGGSVQIAGGKISGKVPRIVAGNGGNGGVAGQSFYVYGEPYPLDGTADEPNGLSSTIVMGSGGGGGGIFITSKTPSNVREQAGSGGNPSSVMLPGPGSGCCSVVPMSPITGTGNGGSLTLYLAAPGVHGPHGNNKPKAPKNGKYSLMKFSGGAGTAWINNNYAGPGASAQGGTGGSLILEPPPHVAIASLGSYGLKIQVTNFGNGGSSMSNCLGAPPSPAGLNGGNAGALHDNGLAPYLSTIYNEWGFNGGNASDGTPPGTGGKAGSNDEGDLLGMAGQDGVAC